MSTKKQLRWFLQQFGPRIEKATSGTPFTTHMLAAIAYKETGYLWSRIRRHTDGEKTFLEMCVGDTIDSKTDNNGKRTGRSAFPRNKKALTDHTAGDKMFTVAREALENIAEVSSTYKRVAKNPDKFCRGYGVFQYDLQFFKEDPDYFLKKRWIDFEDCLGKAIKELKVALKRAKLSRKKNLSIREQASVAIAYNSGRYKASKGLKQGHRNRTTGIYYGEEVYSLLEISNDIGSSIAVQAEVRKPIRRGKVISAYVSTDGLILRKTPNGKEERELSIGEPLLDHGASDDGAWRQVSVRKKKGFVFAKYIRPPARPEVEDLLQQAIYQWIRFDKGNADERTDPYYKLIGKMWKTINLDYDGRSVYPLSAKDKRENVRRKNMGLKLIKPNEVPWSAAFISHVVKNSGIAYSNFKFSSRHSEFVHDAIQSRILKKENRPFWGYRRREIKPELGDIVQRNRMGNNHSFDFAETHSKFVSHSDIVVEVQKDVVRLIGGNVRDSVRMVEYKLDRNGYIAKKQKIIAILRNRAHLSGKTEIS